MVEMPHLYLLTVAAFLEQVSALGDQALLETLNVLQRAPLEDQIHLGKDQGRCGNMQLIILPSFSVLARLISCEAPAFGLGSDSLGLLRRRSEL